MLGAWLAIVAPLPFVTAWWQANADNAGDALKRRHRMADWLLLTGSLTGRTRAEIVARLGEPPPTAYFRRWDMVYALGLERGLISIDQEWLVIDLNAAGRVARARIVRD